MDRSVEQLFDDGFGDAFVRSITWVDDDLVLGLMMPPYETDLVRLRFVYVSRLNIDLDYGDFAGDYPLWSVEIDRQETEEWKICFDYGDLGSIEFVCRDIVQVVSD